MRTRAEAIRRRRPRRLLPLTAAASGRRTDPASSSLIIKIYPRAVEFEVRAMAFDGGQRGLRLSTASSHGIWQIPRVLHDEPAGLPALPSAFAVITLLDGRPLRRSPTSSPTATPEQVYEHMGRLLAAVHQITAARWGYVTTGIVDSKPSNTAYMLGQFAVENAVVADPLLDLAKTDYFALRHSENKRRAFIRGYGSLPPGWGATRGSLPPPPRPGVLELVGFGREAAVLADIRTDLEEIISNDVAQ